MIKTTCLVSALLMLSATLPPQCLAQTDNRIKTAALDTGDSLDIPAGTLEQQAADLISDSKFTDARDLIQRSLKKLPADTTELDLRYLLSLCNYNDGDFKSAAAELQTVLRELKGGKSPHSDRIVWVHKRIGDCYLNMGDYPHALEEYRTALNEAPAPGPNYDLKIKLNESILACLQAMGKLDEALPYARQLLADAKAHAASGTVQTQEGLMWAYIDILDLLRAMGKSHDDERIALRNEGVPVLTQLLKLRNELDQAGALPTIDELKKEFVAECVRENQPRSLGENLWLTLDFKMRTLPLIAWNTTDQPRAAILCIHGLGLENRAFASFGKFMSQKGYLVAAMDVRGFGAWQNMPGQDSVQFKSALDDIEGVVGLIQYKYPGLPIFVVGESMGGGIALQAAAELGNNIAGVIASVPSPDRYQEGRASMSVAMHFLKGKNKSFDIGAMVAKKATSDPVVLKAWQNDPKAKMDMSPLELMKFDKFMHGTAAECKKITTTPVFIVQGSKDRLVKPGGSQELFNAVSNDDKSFLIVGNAEHLIFETEHPSPLLLDSLSTWMTQHMAAAK